MGRLFWKLFTAYWLAFALIIVGVFWGMKLYRQHLEHELFENSSRPEVHTVARTLAEEGEEAARSLLRELRKSRRRLGIVVVNNEEIDLLGNRFRGRDRRHLRHALKNPLIFPQREVTTPDGNTYRVISVWERAEDDPKRSIWDIRWMVLVVAGVVSLLLCFWLARYLSRPIKRLSRASRSYSEGDLDIRVAPDIGSRRDEIADLGRDFDTMAEKLKVLIDGQQQLLRDVSHELRSPLARLQMAVGLARKRQSDSPLDSDELDRIERDVKRLGELVGQVLTLSKLETGVAQHSAADSRSDLVDVAELLAAVVEDADYEARASNCTVALQTSLRPELMADGELLHQALENIVRNAVKYTGDNTAVTVSVDTQCPDGYFRICVCDRGPGVAPQLLETLFEPFVRGSEAREHAGDNHSDHHGYGLGMAITKRAIEQHGGTVTANNRTDGGLCVTVLLPVRETPADDAPTET